MFMVIIASKYVLTIKYYIKDSKTNVSLMVMIITCGMPRIIIGLVIRVISQKKWELRAAIILPVLMLNVGTTRMLSSDSDNEYCQGLSERQ